MRHARTTMTDDQLDQLHLLKRRLSRERNQRVTIEELLQEGIELLLGYYEAEIDLSVPADQATNP